MINPKITKIEGKKGVTYKVHYELTVNGKRTRPSMSFKSKKDAESYKIELIKTYGGREEFLLKDNIKVKDLLEEVLNTHKNKVKKSTFSRYCSFATKINTALGGLTLKQLNVKRLEDFYTTIINKNSSRSNSNNYSEAEKIHKFLHLCLDYAFKWGYTSANIADKVTPPKMARKEVQHWSHAEMDTFLNFIENDPFLYNPVFFALNSGVRIGELCGLQWKHINFKNNIIEIRQQLNSKKEIVQLKTASSSRNIPMFKNIEVLLTNLKQNAKPNQTDFVFLTRNNTPFNNTTLSKTFSKRVKKCQEKNDITKITFHGLRHTYVTLCVTELSIPLEAVSKIVGHAKPSITSDIYFHLNENIANIYFLNKQGFSQNIGNNDPKISVLTPNGTKKNV